MSATKKLSESELLAFILRVLRIIDTGDLDSIHWRTDGEFAPISFFVNCNDCFWWATGDAEDVTPENVHLLEQAYADIRALGDDYKYEHEWSQILFAARVRGLRLQGAAYPKDEKLWPLFDACGPERTTDIANPKPHPSKQKELQTVETS